MSYKSILFYKQKKLFVQARYRKNVMSMELDNLLSKKRNNVLKNQIAKNTDGGKLKMKKMVDREITIDLIDKYNIHIDSIANISNTLPYTYAQYTSAQINNT